MRLAYVSPYNFLVEVGRCLATLGHSFDLPPEAIVCMSVTQMTRTEELVNQFPSARLFVYNWDVYDWSLKNPRPKEYDWTRFKELCLKAEEVWVPSQAEADRYRRWTGREAVVIKSAVPYWTLPEIEPTDGRFVLDTLRETPDPYWGMAEKACRELGIPFVASKHARSFEEYAELLSSCTMTVSTLREASTGGLGLVEAAWYGKPCLVPNNPENAGAEYVPDAFRFAAGNAEDLKQKIKALWENPALDYRPAREDIRKLYSAEAMAKAISERL